MNTGQTYFQKSLIDKGLIPHGIDARHVEGWMRAQFGTLNHLGWPDIRRETKIALDCIREDAALSERNAQSFGL
jgi:hypothetical protein